MVIVVQDVKNNETQVIKNEQKIGEAKSVIGTCSLLIARARKKKEKNQKP